MAVEDQKASSGTTMPTDIDFDAWRQRIRQTTFANYHYQMARAIEAEGNMEAAKAALDRALAIMPEMMEAHEVLVRLLARLGAPEAAAAAHKRALRLDPLYQAKAHFGFFIECCEQLRHAEAIAEFRKVLSLEHDGEIAHSLRRPMWELGAILEKGLRNNEALAVFQELGMTFGDPDALSMTGDIHMRLGQVDDAVCALRKAIALEPSLGDPYYGLGSAAQSLRQHRSALDAFRRASVAGLRTIETSSAYSAIATVRMVLGELAEADAAFRQSEAIEPTRMRVYSFHAYALSLMSRHDEAMAIHQRIVARAHQDGLVVSNQGLSLLIAGHIAQAVETGQHAVSLMPRSTWCWSNLALALHAQGKTDDAVRAYHEAVHIGPASILIIEDDLRPWAAPTLASLASQAMGRAADDH